MTRPRTPRSGPRDWAAGITLSKDLAGRAVAMISDAKQVALGWPFFLYFCPGATHAPHQVPKEWADKYKGKFEEGYEAIRETILARQKQMEIVPPDIELSPINPAASLRSGEGKPWSALDLVRPWDSLSAVSLPYAAAGCDQAF
jgi:arylsulfatase A-like enzyme